MSVRKLKLFTFFIAALCSLQTFSQTTKFADAMNTYKVTLTDEGFVANGFAAYPSLQNETIFANTLLWAVEHLCSSEFNGIADRNFNKLELSFRIIMQSHYFEGCTYSADVLLKVGEHRLIFSASNIRFNASSFLNGKNVRLEKYKNVEKPANQKILDDFEKSLALCVNAIFDYVDNHSVPVSHWDAIKYGRPQAGMNEEECLCSLGKPSTIVNNTDEVQWCVGMGKYLFFRKGVLTKIVY